LEQHFQQASSEEKHFKVETMKDDTSNSKNGDDNNGDEEKQQQTAQTSGSEYEDSSTPAACAEQDREQNSKDTPSAATVPSATVMEVLDAPASADSQGAAAFMDAEKNTVRGYDAEGTAVSSLSTSGRAQEENIFKRSTSSASATQPGQWLLQV
jgi:hypothetical protein